MTAGRVGLRRGEGGEGKRLLGTHGSLPTASRDAIAISVGG